MCALAFNLQVDLFVYLYESTYFYIRLDTKGQAVLMGCFLNVHVCLAVTGLSSEIVALCCPCMYVCI